MKLSESLPRINLNALASIAVLALVSTGVMAQEVAPQPTPLPAASFITDGAKTAGQDVPVPSRKKYVAPEYPLDAAAEGLRGIVILEVLIGEDGRVLNARVTRSIPGLDEAALTAVRQWEYGPTLSVGKPVKVLLSQSITFTLALPDLQRAIGVPELKSGGAPPVPSSLATRESASVAITLGSQGEVAEASVLDGNSQIGEGLLRAVKSWRFVIPEGSTPLSFTVRAEWTPGPKPTLTLRGLDPKAGGAASVAATKTEPAPAAAPAPQAPTAPTESAPATNPPATQAPPVPTEVIPARPEPTAKEQGVSTVADVLLGENIPDLVRGRRPTWPPLARLGAITGDVVVRFSVDLAGKVTVHTAEGAELLKASAEQAVGTWLFRRTAIDRLHLIATFKFGGDRSTAKVERVP